MSDTLEHQIDLALQEREHRHQRHESELVRAEKAIRDNHLEAERRQMRFATEVRSLIRQAVEKANAHLKLRPEKCEFCEVSGYLTGPLYVGGPGCNPIAYELRVNGEGLGETLIVELAHDGMVEAYLGPFRPSICEAHTSRIDFGWPAVPLYQFDARHASDLIVRYLTAITMRWSFRKKD